MNTQLNIKAQRLFSPFVVILLVGVVVVLLSGGVSVQAQTTTATAPADPTAPVDSSVKILAKGTVNDPNNGAITISGSVIVNCRRVVDTTSTTNPSLVVLDFDFSNLSGTSGTGKTQKVYVTGGNHASEIRPLQASDTIIVTVPYYDSTKDALSASSWLVNATLNFDISTGKLTSGSISIGDNVITSAAVGTFTPSM